MSWTKLFPDYEFRIKSLSITLVGALSEPVLAPDLRQAPSSAQRDVQARMLSSTTILVQWKEPEEPNGQIQGIQSLLYNGSHSACQQLDETQRSWQPNHDHRQLSAPENVFCRKFWLLPRLEMVLFQVTFKSLLRRESRSASERGAGWRGELVRRNGRAKTKKNKKVVDSLVFEV